MENQISHGFEFTSETESSKLNTGHFQPMNDSQELSFLDLMNPQEVVGLSDKPFDMEEEYFVLSSEYVAMEDEYVLWKEEVNLRQHKKPVKETGIAEYYDGEIFVSGEENSYSLEERFTA